jgi:hypothetical protein
MGGLSEGEMTMRWGRDHNKSVYMRDLHGHGRDLEGTRGIGG